MLSTEAPTMRLERLGAARETRAGDCEMKTRYIGYWVATGLVAVAFGMGGVMDVLQPPDVVAGMAHLGYPAHFATLLGTIAVLVPGFARAKEWAYAGFFIDLTGAAVAHASVGDPVGNVLTPLVI